MTALIVVLAVLVWAGALAVAWLPVWDRDRPPPPRHVRVPLTDLIGDPR